MVAVMMADKDRINTVPRWRTGKQTGLDIFGDDVVDAKAVAKERVKQNFRITSPDHDAGVREIVCTPRMLFVGEADAGQQRQQYEQQFAD